MAERCVEAVLHDGVPVGSILALTFTEKAAGELRDRIRRRFVALGEDEHARAVDAGWIGTIHGFCARILRARPLAAGLDPRFEVLDEPAAERLAGEAYERAFEEWARRAAPAAIDVAAAYGAGPARASSLRAHATLRSRGETRPRAADPAARARARSRRAAAPRARPRRATRHRRRAAAASRRRSPRSTPASGCSARAACRSRPRARRGRAQEGREGAGQAPSEAYRAAFAAYRQGCADHHARAALVQIAVLLDALRRALRRGQGARAGLDFEDLELGVRDLLAADPPTGSAGRSASR